MAEKSHIEKDDDFFIGDDKELRFEIFDSDEDADPRTMENIAGWGFEWLLRRTDDDAEAHLLRKTTNNGGISVVGTHSVVRSANKQYAVVSIADTDTDGLAPGTYRHVLRRTDAGSETVLSHGSVVLQQAGGRS